MQVYTDNEKLQQLLKRKEFQALLSYFQNLEEPVILREIRKEFPQQTHLDKNLDLLIDNTILSRKDRRYQLSLQTVKSYPTTELVTAFQERHQAKFSAEQLLVWLGEAFWSDDLGANLAVEFPLATCNRFENKDFHLVTINRGGKLPETIPNYFKHVDQPGLFPKMAELVGDVNPDFFGNQIGLIIESAAAGKAPRRESIFLQSLLVSQVMTLQPEPQLKIPFYNEELSLQLDQEWDAQTHFFFVRELAERLLRNQESFTYLIKKKA